MNPNISFLYSGMRSHIMKYQTSDIDRITTAWLNWSPLLSVKLLSLPLCNSRFMVCSTQLHAGSSSNLDVFPCCLVWHGVRLLVRSVEGDMMLIYLAFFDAIIRVFRYRHCFWEFSQLRGLGLG